MGNLIAEKDPQVITEGRITSLEAYGQRQYLENCQMENTNEYRIVKRRKLKSRFRSKMIFKSL